MLAGSHGIEKGKTSLDLNKARDYGVWECSGISWTICKQSAPPSRQITTPTPRHSIFTCQMLFLVPNQQCQSTVGTVTQLLQNNRSLYATTGTLLAASVMCWTRSRYRTLPHYSMLEKYLVRGGDTLWAAASTAPSYTMSQYYTNNTSHIQTHTIH